MNSAGSGRQVEISILEMASGKLRNCIGDNEKIDFSSGIDEVLRFNQKVWDVFCADWSSEQCHLQDSDRQSLLSIGAFVQKRTFTMTAEPTRAGIIVLIELNDNLVKGLKQRPSPQEAI